jgi:hypothetical protein
LPWAIDVQKKGTMMKSTNNLAGKCSRAKGLGSYVAMLCVLALTVIVSGCGPWASPGESTADASRRRQRVLRVNYSEMMADIDKFLMLDEPSRLTDRHLP